MKTTMMILIALLISTISYAQQSNYAPDTVKSSFAKKFPGAKPGKWEKEGGIFETHFTWNKSKCSVSMDDLGQIVEMETKIDLNQLPEGVLNYVKRNYPGQKVKAASKITDDKGNETYEAEIKGMDLIFNSRGEFIKEVKD